LNLLEPEKYIVPEIFKVYGVIKGSDFAAFERYTENVDPAATLVIVTGPGGDLSAGIEIGRRIHQKKLIVGAMGACGSSCALIWIGGETGRKFFYQNRPGVLTRLCFHTSWQPTLRAPSGNMLRAPSGFGEYIDRQISQRSWLQPRHDRVGDNH
jgi:hypothetical protein